VTVSSTEGKKDKIFCEIEGKKRPKENLLMLPAASRGKVKRGYMRMSFFALWVSNERRRGEKNPFSQILGTGGEALNLGGGNHF